MEPEDTNYNINEAMKSDILEFRNDIMKWAKTAKLIPGSMDGRIIKIPLSTDQKAAILATENALNGILSELDDRFSKYL